MSNGESSVNDSSVNNAVGGMIQAVSPMFRPEDVNEPYPTVKILIGPTMSQWTVPRICFHILSPEYATFVLGQLPQENGWILYEDMDDHVFTLLGDFQYTGDYNIIEDPAASYDGTHYNPITFPGIGPVETMSTALQMLYFLDVAGVHPNVGVGSCFDLIEDADCGFAPIAHPVPILIEHLLAHAKLYHISRAHNIPRLADLAQRKLLFALMTARLTPEYARGLAETARYLFTVLSPADPLREAFSRLFTRVYALFSEEPAYVAVVDQFFVWTYNYQWVMNWR